MTRVGGGEPKVTGSSLTQAKDVPEAIPPYEPPSPPLTPEDRHSVEQDLNQQRRAFAQHDNTEPLPGRRDDWRDRYWMFAREIARLERMLADDNLNIIDHGCMAAVLAGGETWEQFMADAEERMGLPWSEIKDVLNERSANRNKATT